MGVRHGGDSAESALRVSDAMSDEGGRIGHGGQYRPGGDRVGERGGERQPTSGGYATLNPRYSCYGFGLPTLEPDSNSPRVNQDIFEISITCFSTS